MGFKSHLQKIKITCREMEIPSLGVYILMFDYPCEVGLYVVVVGDQLSLFLRKLYLHDFILYIGLEKGVIMAVL